MKRSNWTHRLFQVSVAIKGIDGLLELVAGTLMLIFGATRINHFLTVLSSRELHEDARDLVANFIARHTHLSTNSVHFAAFYLLLQGGVKVWLAEALLHERKHVFPFALVILTAFELYLGYRIVGHADFGRIFLASLNLVIIILVLHEYHRLRQGKRGPG